MKRREFIALLGGAAAATSLAPLVTRAQGRVAVIGLLASGSPDPQPYFNGITAELRALGYIENETVRFIVRSAQGDPARLPEMAAELARLKPDVIVAYQTPAATAAKQATNTVPIVLAGVGDPVATGLVQSLAMPGGNITGVSGGTAQIVGKNIELLSEILPKARRIAVLLNEHDPFAKTLGAQIEIAGRATGLEMQLFVVSQNSQLEAVLVQAQSHAMDAVIVQPTLLGDGKIVDVAMKQRLPVFSLTKLSAAMGGVASYHANYEDTVRQIAGYIDKILKGRKPADLPVAFPTKFELVINLKSAKALGIGIPSSLLARADEVIE